MTWCLWIHLRLKNRNENGRNIPSIPYNVPNIGTIECRVLGVGVGAMRKWGQFIVYEH